jgi:hypothetical protein
MTDDLVLTPDLKAALEKSDQQLAELEQAHIEKLDKSSLAYRTTLDKLLLARQPEMDKREDLWGKVFNADTPLSEFLGSSVDQKLARAIVSLSVVAGNPKTTVSEPSKTRVVIRLKTNMFTEAGDVIAEVDEDVGQVSVVKPIVWKIPEKLREKSFFGIFTAAGAEEQFARGAIGALREVFLSPLVFLEDD